MRRTGIAVQSHVILVNAVLARQVQWVRAAVRVQLVRAALPADKGLLVRRVRKVQLPRQYMHNKENAVTMRLSAH